MSRNHNLGAEAHCPLFSGVEVIDLEPQQHPIAIRPVITIGDRSMVMILFEAMQLHDDPLAINKPLVLRPAVTARASKECLIPATTRFHIGYDDEGLRTHRFSSRG